MITAVIITCSIIDNELYVSNGFMSTAANQIIRTLVLVLTVLMMVMNYRFYKMKTEEKNFQEYRIETSLTLF